jgi:uncharacterized Fe-S cluster protein YjdI
MMLPGIFSLQRHGWIHPDLLAAAARLRVDQPADYAPLGAQQWLV